MTKKLSGVLHIRALDIVTDVAPKLRPEAGVSLAYSVGANGDVVVGFAVCSFRDRFDRSLGKKIAVGRLQSERNPLLRQTLDSSALSFIAKEMFGIDAVVEPVVGKDGEYFVHESQFPLTKLLLTLSKTLALELLMAELQKEKLVLKAPMTEANVEIVRFGKSYAYHYEPGTPELEVVA